VTAVALSPDGQYALSGSRDNTVKVWDLLTGEPVVTFSGDSLFMGCAVAPDGVTMVAGDGLGVVHFLRWEIDSSLLPLPRRSPGADNPASLFYRGLSWAQQGRGEEAFACWQKAVNLRPDAAPRIWQQGGKALLWAGECYEEAARCFQNGVQLQPDNPELWNGLAIAQRRAGDAEAALSTYDRALELQPDAPYLWANRAYALRTLGSYPEAQANFHQALKLDPTYANAYYNLACLYALQGKVELALDHLRQAIDFNPKYRELAKTYTDFDGIRQDTRFRALIENRAIPGTD
ncbi:WD40 repeat domain-containing protein, partial [Phormidium sp. CCY1219]|uniref:WD40 repeat domain-containing protein n=1 Tax=Phormidium sp. CCY1219 TaxID=2886104 RepID=UPI002D1E866B